MADPFDEFEFKPLTEGLGFHKKAEKIKAEILKSDLGGEKMSRAIPAVPPRSLLFSNEESLNDTLGDLKSERAASQSIADLMASLPPSLDFLEEKPKLSQLTQAERQDMYQPPKISHVLPTPGTRAGAGTKSNAAAAFSTAAMTGAIPAPLIREGLNESYARAFPQTEKAKAQSTEAQTGKLVPVAANLAAGVIDAMVTIGVATLFLVCILMITQINLIGMLNNARTDTATHLHLALLVISVMQLYMLVSRAFFGATLGEWAFDLQMGSDKMQSRAFYPVLVIWRTLVTTATGLVLLPLLSFGFGRDLTKYFTGLQLYRRP